jgi:hypothetical protein
MPFIDRLVVFSFGDLLAQLAKFSSNIFAVRVSILASEFVHPLFQLLPGFVLDHNSALLMTTEDDLQKKRLQESDSLSSFSSLRLNL